jgi:outer membrane protein assembly factor BamB
VSKFLSIFLLFILSSCSLDTKSGIWTKDKDLEKTDIREIKIFDQDEILKKELNTNFNLEINHKTNEINNFNTNNTGILDHDQNFEKSSKFKFKKIKNFNYFEPDLISDGDNFLFFDGKLNLLKFNKNFELVWKKNIYSKIEKKNKPLLWFSLDSNYLIVADTIGKIFKIDFNSGEILWSKKNNNPINSQIKIYKDKIYFIDLNNIMRCLSLINGKELWKFNGENTFLKSDKRKSIAIKDDKVFFNNSVGDITALQANDGTLLWQMPTQSSLVYENAFSMESSDIVIFEDDLFFSNNRNEFYSVNLNNGFLNWEQKVNSSIRPVITDDFVLTISNEGFLFVIDRHKGNIIKITDIFDVFKETKRKKIFPVGFFVGKKSIIVSTNIGKILVVDIYNGKTSFEIKIDNKKISRPFVFNNMIILVKDDAVIRIN